MEDRASSCIERVIALQLPEAQRSDDRTLAHVLVIGHYASAVDDVRHVRRDGVVGVSGDVWPRASELRYAQRDGAHLAYRVLNGGGMPERDVVHVTAGTMPMDALFDDPVALRLLEGLSNLGRLIMFDRCGIGLSDPPPDSDTSGLAGWCADIEAVAEAADVVRAVLVADGSAMGPTILYCDRHSAAVSAMVLMEPRYGRLGPGDIVRQQIDGELDSVAVWCPSRADEPGFREWFHRAGQRGASPGRPSRAYPGRSDDDIRVIEEAAQRVEVPTLVLRRPAHPLSPPRATDPIVALIPNAVRVDLPGEDLLVYGAEVDALLAELTGFVTGEVGVPPAPERTLAVVMFSDVVASTDRASALGDTRWKRLLDRHDEVAHSCVARRGGVIIKHMGDGLVATFASVSSALRAAQDLRAALLVEGLEIRVGIHVGDVDRRGDDISGLGVVIAARVEGLAAPGEILATSTAVQAATGEIFHFEPRGEHHLKGVSGTWNLFALTSPAN